MAASVTCSACGCDIVNGKTATGACVVFAQKTYCGECANLILPPEEIARLSRPGASKSASSGLLSADDDVFGEGEATKKQVATGERLAAPVPTLPATASPKVSGSKMPGVAPSRRTSTSTNVKGRRSTTSTGIKPDRDGRDGRDGRDLAKSKMKKPDSTGLYIGLGVGAIALIVGGYFIFKGDSRKKGAEKKPAELVDNDKTPSTEYARKAEQLLEKNDRKGAVSMYGKAADRAEKEGNTDQAKSYNIKSMNLVKSSKLND